MPEYDTRPSSTGFEIFRLYIISLFPASIPWSSLLHLTRLRHAFSSFQSVIVARALMSEIITGLWIGVSLWGAYAGWRGYNAEAKFTPQNARIPQRVVTPEVYKWKKTHRPS